MTLPVHRCTLRVRYEETDRMGVVYHANHFRYFEIGRTEIMRARGVRYRDLEEDGTFLAVVEIDARFRGRVTYDDEITVETTLAMEGRSRFRFTYRILNDGCVVSEGHTSHACVNREGRPVRPPTRLVEKARMGLEEGP